MMMMMMMVVERALNLPSLQRHRKKRLIGYKTYSLTDKTFNTATELSDFLKKLSNFNQGLDTLENLCRSVKTFFTLKRKFSLLILFKSSIKNHYRKCTQ